MAAAGNIDRDNRGKCSTRSVERAVAALAGRQHGVVSRAQLIAIGLSEDMVDRRLASSRLHAVHRGVYAIGHTALSPRGVWMAAVLAAGADAVLSHRSAAALWGVRNDPPARVEVIVPRKIRRPELRAYRLVLPADEVTTKAGIPVTTAARTLFDLAAELDPEYLEAAVTEAEIQRLTSPTSLGALVARYPGRKATPVVRDLLRRAQIGRNVTKSDLEIAFLALLRRHGLPRPRTNVRIAVRGTPMVDAAWAEQRLVVELDSYGIHTTRRNFENDRARDRELLVAGWRIVRITWRQLTTEPATIARQLRILLRDTVPPP